jgi:hypothetical protein
VEVKDRAVLAGPLNRDLALCDDFIASDTAVAFARTARNPLQAAAL